MKSRLIAEFANRSKARFIKLGGVPPAKGVNNATQLRAIAEQLSKMSGEDVKVPENWFDAFHLINDAINPAVRIVLLLDEISWMGKYDPTFSGYLKTAWDNLFHKNENLIVVLCGSVSAWISDEILNSTGFVGRISSDMVIRELPPDVCLKFWGRRASRVSSREENADLPLRQGQERCLPLAPRQDRPEQGTHSSS